MKIEMDAVRPDPVAPLEEYRLFLALLPIRLHLDQHHIDFCINFFSPRAGPIVPPHSGLVDDSLYPSAGSSINSVPSYESGNPDTANDAFLPYFQICELQPLSIRLDYLPRHIDLMALREGNYAELLNLVSWKGIELHLKHIRAAGVHGWSSLSGIIFGEWLEDISQNQIHKFVQGVGPIRPLYAVGSGAAKLLVLPAEHYHKDRRLLRGMRKGAFAFVRSISLEALSLGAHLAAGAHEILQHAEVALGGSPTQPLYSIDRGELRSRPPQPGDTREGFQQACESMSQGLERTASSLLGNPLKVYQRGAGAGLAVASALWAAPAAAVAPASAAAVAVQRALLGVRNGLDPEHKWESDQKHTGPPPDVRRNW
jgi:autophagy-related protein 2